MNESSDITDTSDPDFDEPIEQGKYAYTGIYNQVDDDNFQKSGSVTFVSLWCPNFMQKTRKN